MKNKTEFKAGDIVTFKPYEKVIKAKVVEIVPSEKVCFDKNDTRVFYRLTGVDKKHNLVSTTTGKSIVESKLYNNSEEVRSFQRKARALVEKVVTSKNGYKDLTGPHFIDFDTMTTKQACDVVYRMTGKSLSEVLK